VLTAVAIIPSAPVVVPELAGDADEDLTALRSAVHTAVAGLPRRWVVLGCGQTDAVIPEHSSGTFAGFGVDLTVRLGPDAAAEVQPLPLCALIAGWARAAAPPDTGAEVHVYADHPDRARAAGRRLRAGLEASARPVGALVVADGAITLTPGAPGGHRPADRAAQCHLDTALRGGDIAALSALPPAIRGRAAFAALAGLSEPGPRAAVELYCAAPYGVGYFVGTWAP